MSMSKAHLAVLSKLLVAAIALVALVAVAARQLLPSVTLGELLLYSAAGVIGVMAVVILGAICSLQFSQFILRAGGTDPQWFWFRSEPAGLVALRGRKEPRE